MFQEADGGAGGCPFCRAEIKGTEHIIVDPFTPGKQRNSDRRVNSKTIIGSLN